MFRPGKRHSTSLPRTGPRAQDVVCLAAGPPLAAGRGSPYSETNGRPEGPATRPPTTPVPAPRGGWRRNERRGNRDMAASSSERICVVVGRTRHKMVQAEIKEAVRRGARLIELRLDFLAKAPDFQRLLDDKPCSMM